MQTFVDTCAPNVISPSSGRLALREPKDAGLVLQNVRAGAPLYRPGEHRRLFRVEAGALCHTIQWPDGRLEVIEFAFQGDIVGLGQLNTHISSANALSDTVVSIVDEDEFSDELRSDDILDLRYSAALEREFDYLRERARHAPKRQPVALVASYLLAVGSMNKRQRKSADFISNEHCNETIVKMLGLDIDEMAHSLLQLQKSGLIESTLGGLRLANISGLERLADRT